MNDYENDTFRITETARAVHIDRMLARADDFEDYQEWLSETDDYLDGLDWRTDAAMSAWEDHLETPW